MLVLLSHPQAAKVTAKVCDEGFSEDGKGITYVGERHEQKTCSDDGNVLHQKSLSLYKDCSKGSPEMCDTKPFSASEEMVIQIQECIWAEKIQKSLQKPSLMTKKLLPHILQN